MATGTDSCIATIQEEFLQCKICYEELLQPKSLPCLHTFCLPCLEKCVSGKRKHNSKFPCPLCRKEFKIPCRGLRDLPTNFMLQGLKDVVKIPKENAKPKKKTQKCTNHKSATSDWFCTTCCVCVCGFCKGRQHSQHPCNIISMSNEDQFIEALYQLQEEKTTTLHNRMKNWGKECLAISSKVSDIQKSREKLKEKANAVYEDIEKKLREEKKLISERIDREFEKQSHTDGFLAQFKDFEKEMADTSSFLRRMKVSQQKTDLVSDTGSLLRKIEVSRQKHDMEAAIKNWNDIGPLVCRQAQDLENSYKKVKKGEMASLPKLKLEVMEQTVDTIKNKPLVDLGVGPHIDDIICIEKTEFDLQFWGEYVIVGDMVFGANKICFIDYANDCVRMYNQDGLDTFSDRFDNYQPWSLCYLPVSDIFAVSYFENNEIKIFNSRGMFRQKIYMDENGATLCRLSDDTIAVGHQDNYIEFYDSNFKRVHKKPPIICDTHPRNMCADKDDNIFFSDGKGVYFWDQKEKNISNISQNMEEFNPCGLCMDIWGNLLVANCLFSKIHIFSRNMNGSWKEKNLLDARRNKIYRPKSMAFNMDDELVVGQMNGTIKTFDYTLDK